MKKINSEIYNLIKESLNANYAKDCFKMWIESEINEDDKLIICIKGTADNTKYYVIKNMLVNLMPDINFEFKLIMKTAEMWG